MTGWICPKCSRVWAPSVTNCSPCNLTVTCPIYPYPYMYPLTIPVYPMPSQNPWWWPQVWCVDATSDTYVKIGEVTATFVDTGFYGVYGSSG